MSKQFVHSRFDNFIQQSTIMQKKREKQDRKKPQKKTVNVKMMSRWTTKKNRKRKKKTRTESNKKTKTEKTVPMERCWDEQKKERTGRNPRTGEAVQVDEKFIPRFKTGKELRLKLNSKNNTSVSQEEGD